MVAEAQTRSRSLNIRLRLALVCALFAAPLLLSLSFAGELILHRFDVNARELADVAKLKTAWAALPADSAGGSATIARLRERLGRALILDDRADAYRLAEALNADLLNLAVSGEAEGSRDVETARYARAAAEELSAAAASLPIDALRSRLSSRADLLRAAADQPGQPTRAQARQLWSDTLADLGQVLTLRRDRMVWSVGLALGATVAFSLAGCLIAISIARGLTRRVAGLSDEIERLIRRDTHGVTPYLDDAHEIGRIAKGVEALRRALVESRGAWGEVLMNEMRYSLLAENMREVILLTDLEGGVVFASPSASRLGRDPRDLEATPATALFARGAAADLRRAMTAAGERPVDLPALKLARGRAAWNVSVERPPDQDENLVWVLTPVA